MENNQPQLNSALLNYFNGSHNFTQQDYNELCRYTRWVMSRWSPNATRAVGISVESVVSMAFSRFLKSYDPSKGTMPTTYWNLLVRSSVNFMWQHYHKRQKWVVSVDMKDLVKWYEAPATTYDFDKARRLFLLDYALNQLTDQERLLIHRIYWLKESYRTIGFSLSISHGTVAVHHTAILKKLRHLILSMENKGISATAEKSSGG